ncbi:MAG: tetratricopeptide repeat protein [Planctomycetota bacterium]
MSHLGVLSTRLTLIVCFAALVLCCGVFAADLPGTAPYIAGLDEMERAKWDDAITAFTQAIKVEDENADYHLARSVANAFSEQLEAAQRDVDRAARLRPNHKLTKLFQATIIAMQGRFKEDAKFYPLQAPDTFDLAVREMSHKYGEAAFRLAAGQTADAVSMARLQEQRDTSKAQFADFAKQFVVRVKPEGASLAGALKSRGVERYKKRLYSEALDDLEWSRRWTPNDSEIVFFIASCKLDLRFYEGARADFTRALQLVPNWGSAYIGRALAHAALGNSETARADFALGQKYDPKSAAVWRDELERQLTAMDKPTTASQRNQMLIDLKSLVSSGAKSQAIFLRAISLVRAVHATRLHADERYSLRLQELRDAVADEGKASADAYAALSAFLYEEATSALFEWVEPRDEPKSVRGQTDAMYAAELDEAEQVADKALKLNPKHGKALAIKVACLFEKMKFAEAEPIIASVLEAAPTESSVLDIFVRLIVREVRIAFEVSSRDVANLGWAAANDPFLRFPKSYGAKEAPAIRAQGIALGEKLVPLLKSVVESEYSNDPSGARTALESAVKKQPDFVAAWRKLGGIYGRLNLPREQADAYQSAANITHTTAAPMLKFAWTQFTSATLEAAGFAVIRAGELDPADPRVAAFRGVLARESGNALDAANWFTVAAALREANAQFNGTRLKLATGAPLRASDVGLAIQLNYLTGELALEANAAERAAVALEENVTLYQRIEESERYVPAPGAMLPHVSKNAAEIPPAQNIETIMAWSRLRLGQAYLKLNRNHEANRELVWIINFDRRRRQKIEPGAAILQPARQAIVYLIKTALARNDFDGAQNWLDNAPNEKDLPPNVVAELTSLRTHVERGQPITITDPVALYELRQSVVINQKSSIEQRQTIERALADPNTTEQVKKALGPSLNYWNKKIIEAEKKLNQIDAVKPK